MGTATQAPGGQGAYRCQCIPHVYKGRKSTLYRTLPEQERAPLLRIVRAYAEGRQADT